MNMPKFFTSFKHLFISGLLILVSMSAHAESESTLSEPISQAQLEQMLAPIALYPDTILSHILVAATYPLDVVQAERWTERNPDLQGAEAVQAVDDQEWDPSVRALVAFPQILKRMSEDLDWTQQLGDAFLRDEQQVLASVQILRKLASQAGSLDQMKEVSVIHEDRVIIIEPREREVVYVPYYDTRVVYGPWRWQQYDPIFWDYPYYDRYSDGSYYSHNRDSSFYWGPRVSLSFGFFFNTFSWQDRHLVRISPRHYRPNHYYSHSEILAHHNSERWVHNPAHRDGHRNRRIVNRDSRRDNYQNARIEKDQRQGTWSQWQTPQERVRNQLLIPQNNVVVRRNNINQNSQVNTSRVNNRVADNARVNNSSAPVQTSQVQMPQPIRNSGEGISSRARPVEEVRGPSPRNLNRELERQRPSRLSQQTGSDIGRQQGPAVIPAASRPSPPATRPSPPREQAQSKPVQPSQTNNPPQSIKPRSGPKNTQTGPPRERSQPR
jgi:hypothetical protein